MRRLESTWLDQIRRREDRVQQTTVLVACSGGGDSTALLAFLWSIRSRLGLELVVAHADHGLRPESEADAAFVRDLCRTLDVDLTEIWLDVPGHAKATGCGLETAARDLRWSWLRTEAAACGASVVATGHTLDDHSETVFLRLLRHGGSGALVPLPARQGLRWSPLVEARREDLRTYLRQLGMPWREDETNRVGFTPRNRIRPWLAQLREEAPSLDRHLWETHLQVRELLELREQLVEAWKGSRWSVEADGTLQLAPGLSAPELCALLPTAFHALGWPCEAATLRDLVPWITRTLNLKSPAPKTWGGWSLRALPCPEGGSPRRALSRPVHLELSGASKEGNPSHRRGGTLDDSSCPQEAP